jgi:hypothetical protein
MGREVLNPPRRVDTEAQPGPERRHEAGAGIQAVRSYALWVFVNLKPWAI